MLTPGGIKSAYCGAVASLGGTVDPEVLATTDWKKVLAGMRKPPAHGRDPLKRHMRPKPWVGYVVGIRCNTRGTGSGCSVSASPGIICYPCDPDRFNSTERILRTV